MDRVILAFDTSTALSSVALVDGGVVVVEFRHLDARRHAEVIGPLFARVREQVDPSRIEAVVCGVGPGPYTGLRVGIASALAVGVAWRVPVHGICSLDAIAAATQSAEGREPGPICVASDARRSEVYWACYGPGGARLEGPRVSRPWDIDDGLRAGEWAGHGAAIHPDAFSRVDVGADDTSERAYPTAAGIALLAGALFGTAARDSAPSVLLDAHGEDTGSTSRSLGGAGLLAARPLYLRRPDAVAAGGPV